MKEPITFPGQELRDRRNQLEVSLEEAYRATRIPIATLDALERGDMRALPEGGYAVGFIKTYCAFLEMPHEPYVDCYRSCTRPVPHGFLSRTAASASEARRPPWLTNLLAWAAVCAIVALCWFAYTVLFDPQAGVNDGRVDAGAVDMILPPAAEEGK